MTEPQNQPTHNDLTDRELERVTQWVDPEEWFGVLDGYTGELWNVLTRNRRDAEKITRDIDGRIVVITTRIGADDEGEYLEPRKI